MSEGISNKSKKSKKNNLDKIPVKKVALGILGFIICVILLYYIFTGLVNLLRSYKFEYLTDLFKVEYYKIWDDKFNSGFGLKGKDHVNFEINIRTEDASDDCKIKGEIGSEGLNKIKITGSGTNCIQLRENNKL